MSDPDGSRETDRQSPESIAAGLLFIALFAVVLIQVFGRTPLFVGPVWTEELARWIWVWMAFVGIAEVERQDGQLRMAFLADALPARARLALYTVIDLVYLGLTGHLVLIAWRTIQRTARSESVTLPWPDALMYTATFVAFVLIFHRVVRRILARIKAARSGMEETS